MRIPPFILAIFAILAIALLFTYPGQEIVYAQEASPTVGAPAGLVATVNSDDQDEINVRSGPGTDYALIGKLYAGQQVPALGRSPGGDWVKISFPGVPGNVAWVYAYLVTINGILPVVEPPATPTPRVTPTIDQTLAAQFIREAPPTRLPTFTPPPPLVIPTFPQETPVQSSGGAAVVYVMITLAVLGLAGLLVSFIKLK